MVWNFYGAYKQVVGCGGDDDGDDDYNNSDDGDEGDGW